ncbi:MarR family winged helix-turn-helix transcriptional regulator [Algiphilus sp.]|uniref:MarR family winged helix-turn-helix transcriptional regulator n=1 Tax=Algiphilus sp. TaxID=1872431 RepID=UPI003B524BE2
MNETTSAADAQRTAEMLVHVGRIARCEAQTPSLTPAQWSALRFFAHANRMSRTPSAFARFHATTRGTASQTVKSLETAGYLERRRADVDGRSVVFDLTPSGWAQLAADPLNTLSAAIEALPPEQQHTLSEALQQLAGALAQDRDGQAFGSCGECGFLGAAEQAGCPFQCRCTGTLLSDEDFQRLCANFTPRATVETPAATRPGTKDA